MKWTLERKKKPSEGADVMEIMNVDTKESAQNSDSREQSRNLLESVAGGASDRMNQHRSVEKMIGPKLLKGTSEYRELSQKSWSSEKDTDEETSRKLVHRMLSKCMHLEHSESREHSQNSLSSGEPELDKGEANMSSSDCDGQCLAMVNEFRKLSSNLRVETECSEGTQHKQNTKFVCISEPSEYLRDLLGGVGSNVSVPRFSWFKSMSQIVGLTATWQQDKVEGNPTGANTACNAKTNPNPVHAEFNFFL